MTMGVDPASQMLCRAVLNIPQTRNSEQTTLPLSFGYRLRNCLKADSFFLSESTVSCLMMANKCDRH
jgi:hypothetical protein